MLTPQQLEKVADTIVPIWDELKEWITLDLIDRIISRLDSGEDISFSSSEQWRIEVFKKLGGLIEDLQEQIVKTTRASEQEVKRIFLEYGEQAVRADNAVFDSNNITDTEENISQIPDSSSVREEDRWKAESLTKTENALKSRTEDETAEEDKPLSHISERMKDIMNDAYERTNGELRNFTRTTADSVQTEFIKELDNAYLKVVSNACSQWQAAQEAVDNIIKHQGYVTYPSGHVDTIEVAVIRAIRTGIARMSAALVIEGAKEHGMNHVLVSSHLGARVGDETESPCNHAWWQGKVYSIEGGDEKYPNLEKVTGYPSDPRGLCGYNCRHNLTAFDPETMKNNTKKFDDEENKKAYEFSQKLRYCERNIRKAKTEVMALSKAIENCKDENLARDFENELDKAKARLDRLNEEYKKLCEDNDLRVAYERLYVARTPRNIEDLRNKGVANSAESGISSKINSANSNNNVDLEYISSREYHDKFKGITGDYKVDEQIFKQSKAMLIHRNKSDKEDMCLIDSRTGKIAGRQTNSKSDFGVDYNSSLNNAIKNTPRDILISIHNHPTNNPPTGSDIVSNGANGYKLGIVVTHNGKVFAYKAGNKPFTAISFGKEVDKYRSREYNLNEYDAIIKVLDEYKRDYGIEWSERV